ncbi:gamma-glutamyltransferase [Seonamhaeicola maritimus]|uniref:Glutathione hydrolase proenzyme n=1 Tax=Seonamhaeicola maritimus TaxID=2591822 RepID=A0A5C7GF11_9FLAO|nr:gamma-glutamyltransferase [Seonamhaeicola maritimus]TXG35433.1 gamma-glutamyltransferase [Seonamhaeicola maritimus]
MIRLICIIFLLLPFTSCKSDKGRGLVTKNAMVVSAREEASKIGISILKQGGNAFDAMVATELALAVAYPIAGNLGGGGFMVYRKNNGDTGTLDYREKAPINATTNMYLDKEGEVITEKSRFGALAVGVPGTVAGIFAAHEKYGSLPIENIIQPVIELAKRGVVVTEKQEKAIKHNQSYFLKVNKDSIIFNKPWKAGDTIKHVQLANTLSRLMEYGKNEFYIGEIAEKLIKHIQDHGGIITKEDLAQYEPKWRKPITFTYDNLKITSISPPSSGGICLAQIMKMIEPFDLEEFKHNSTKYVQVLTEAERRSYADRSFYLGDPDFISIPTNELINNEYLKERMRTFSFEKATLSSDVSYGNIEIVESNETTHYSIVDSFGNAVSVTTTLNGAYGSKLYCNELGFFLNNEMDDFSSKPGAPNMYGLVGAQANKILPEKRMLSSMTPTIIEKDNKLYMVLGTPGGSTIITSVLQTILNVHEHNMTMQEAVNAPRFHHQWLPDYIRIEPNSFNNNTIEELQVLGYSVNEKKAGAIGKVDGILVLEDESLEGGADYRGDDTAVGF